MRVSRSILASMALAELQRRGVGQEPMVYQTRNRVRDEPEETVRVPRAPSPATPSARDIERMSAAEAKRARKAAKRLKDRARTEGGQG